MVDPGRHLNDSQPQNSSSGQTPAFMKRMGLYEKGLERRAKREEKIRLIREQMMEECTFTPNTVKSQSTRGTQNTGSSQSTHSPVWDRLYPTPVLPSKSNPQVRRSQFFHSDPPRRRTGPSRASASTTDARTMASYRSRATAATTASNSSRVSTRIEQLYEHGRSKLRSRPLTDRAEAEWRRQRLENEELKSCTFQPRAATSRPVPSESRRLMNRDDQVQAFREIDRASGLETVRNPISAAPVLNLVGRRTRPGGVGSSSIRRHPEVEPHAIGEHCATTTGFPTEITVVTRSFSTLASSMPAAGGATTIPMVQADDGGDAIGVPLGSFPTATGWKTPSPIRPFPSPPPSQPVQPHRPKSENVDFMVDLSSLCEEDGEVGPPLLPPSHPSRLVAAARESGAIRTASARQPSGHAERHTAATTTSRDSKPSTTRANEWRPQRQAPPGSSLADSTLSTEYGSI